MSVWPGRYDWQLRRSHSEVLRWICADCLLLNAEHHLQFWGCNGRHLTPVPPLPR